MEALKIATLADIERIEQVPLVQRMPWRSVGALLESAAAQHGSSRAWTYLPDPQRPEVQLQQSHAEFNASLRKAAAVWRRLATLHDVSRPVVACLMHHCPQAHQVIWSAECVGIAMPINPMLEVSHIAGLIQTAGASILVISQADPQIWSKVKALVQAAPSIRSVVAVQDEAWSPSGVVPDLPFELMDWDEALSREDASVPLDVNPPADPLEACAWFHTGGTTGKPKLAPQHHLGQVFDNCLQAAMYGLGPGHVVFAAMPLFHVAGLTLTGLTPLSAGASLLMVGSAWRNKALYPVFWKLVQRHRVSHVSAVPTVLGTLLDVPVDADISSLTLTWCGAAPLPRATLAKFEAHAGVRVIEGYGATELHCVATQNPLHGEQRVGSIGLRLPYTEVCVRQPGPAAQQCRVNEVGHLMFRGPHVFQGYLGVSPHQQPLDAEGWYDSGDIGWQDAEGYLWLAGRARDLIIRGGHNIDPGPVEEALLRHPAVESAAVVARPDPHAGEVPVAFVTLRRGHDLADEALLAHLRAQATERAALPDWIQPLPELPHTAVGKLARNRLRAMAAQRTVVELLKASGIAVREVIASDEGRGVIAEVELMNPRDLRLAEEVLGRLALQAKVRCPPM